MVALVRYLLMRKYKKRLPRVSRRNVSKITHRGVHASLDKLFGKSADAFLIYRPYVFTKIAS